MYIISGFPVYILDVYVLLTHPVENVNKNMAWKHFSIDLFVWLNVLLSVLVVLLNKRIYTHYGFSNVSLTFLHFAMSTVCVFACEKIGVFRRKSIRTADLLPLSLTLCSFVVFTNFSLQTNTVGTYLAFKMATTPLIVVMETLWCCRKFSNGVLLTLVSRAVFHWRVKFK